MGAPNFDKLFYDIADPVAVVNRKGDILEVNKSVKALTNFGREELVGKNFTETKLFTGKSKMLLSKMFTERMKGKKIHPYQVEVKTKDGSIIPVEVNASKTDFKGMTVDVVVFRDISKRKEFEEKLEKSKEEFKDFLDTANDPVQSVDSQGKFVYVNEKWKELLGYSEEEIKTLKLVDILREDKISEFMEAFSRIKQDEQERIETVFLSKDGKELFVEGTVNPLFEKEKFVQARCIFRDVTQRKRQEEKIKHLNMVLKAIRDVNKLITKEGNKEKLLKEVCDELIESRGYKSSWIALFDKEGDIDLTSQAGLGKKFKEITKQFEKGENFLCTKKAFKKTGLAIITDTSSCKECPLIDEHKDTGVFVSRLEHNKDFFGFLCVAVPKKFTEDKEEQELFKEISEDLAFALYNIDLEQTRRKTEKALQKSQSRLSSLIENAPEFVYLVTRKGKIDSFNKPLPKSDPEKLIGTRIYSYIKEAKEKNFVREAIKNVFDNGKSSRCIFRMADSDGERLWYELKTGPVKQEDKTILATLFITDVTELKQAEEELEKSEKKYRHLAEKSKDIIYSSDKKGCLTYVNPQAKKYGLEPEKMKGKKWIDFVHKDDKERVRKEFLDSLEKEREKPTQFRIETPDGKTYWVEDFGGLRKDEKGKIFGMTGILRDITKRKEMEQKIRQKNEDLKLLNELNDSANQGDPLKETLSILAERTRNIFSSHGANVYLLNPEKTYLELQHISFEKKNLEKIESMARQKIIDAKIPLTEENPYKKILEKGEPIILNDPDKLKQLAASFESTEQQKNKIDAILEKIKIKSVILVPLYSKEALGILDISREKEFTEEDLERVSAFAKEFTNLLERKKAEEALKKSEKKYRELVEDVPGMVYRADQDWNIEIIGGGAEKITGYGKKIFEDKIIKWKEIIIPEDRKRIIDESRVLEEKPTTLIQEYRIKKKNEEITWIRDYKRSSHKNGKMQRIEGIVYDINELKQAEEELKESEASLKQAQKLAQIGNWEWNIKENSFRMSEGMREIHGIPKEEKYGDIQEIISEFVHPEDKERVSKAMRQVNGKKHETLIYRIIREDGQERWIAATSPSIRKTDKNQIPESMIGIVQDITEKKKAEQALKASEEKYRLLSEHAADVIFQMDLDQNFTYISPSIERILGYTPEEAMEMSPKDFLTEESSEKVITELKESLIDGSMEPSMLEIQAHHKNGTRLWLEINSEFLLQNKEPIGVIGVCRDITHHKTMQEKLVQEKNLNSKYLDLSNILILILDKKGKIKLINKKGAELLGCSKEELIGKSWFNNFLPQKVRKLNEKLFEEMMNENLEGDPGGEGKIITKNGETRLILWQNTLLKDSNGEITGMLSSGQDITHQEEIRQNKEEFEKTLKSIPNHIFRFKKEKNNLVAVFSEGEIARKYNIATDEIKGKKLSEIFTGEEYAQIKKHYEKAFSGENVTFETRIKNKWFETNLAPYKEKEGKISEIVGVSVLIDDLKNIEEELREKAEILSATHDSVVVTDLDGKIKYVNESTADALGWKREELLNKKIFKFGGNTPEGKAKQEEILKNVLVDGVWKGEVKNYNKNGEEVLFDSRIFILRDKEGNPRLLAGLSRNITEKRKEEKSMKENEEKLRHIIAHSKELYYIHDTENNITYISPQSKEMLGYDPEDLKFKWTELISDNPTNIKGLNLSQKAIETGKRQGPYKLELKRKDGTTFFCEVNESPLKDSDGKVIGITGALRDITQQLKAEEETKKTYEKYQRIFETSRDAIMTLSPPEWNFTSCNPATLEMFKIKTEEEFKTKTLEDISPEKQPDGTPSSEKLKEIIENALDSECYRIEWTHKKSDGREFPAIMRLTRFSSDGEEHLQATIRDITSRKQAEEKLKKSEEKYRNLTEETKDVIYSMDTEGKLTYISPQVKNYGFQPEKMLNKDWNKFIHPEDRERVTEEFIQSMQTGSEFPSEFRVKDPKGNITWFEDIGRVKRDKDGQITGLTGVLRDITERKKAQKELKESEQRFREMVNLLPQMVFETDKACNVTFVNETGMRELGYTSDEVKQGIKLSQVVIPEQRPEAEKILTGILKKERPGGKPIEFKVTKKNGETLDAIVYTRPIIKEGQVNGLRGIAIDITKLKQTQEKIKKSEERLEDFLEDAGELIQSVDKQGKFIYVNKKWKDTLGYSEKEIENLTLWDILRKDQIPHCQKIFKKILEGKRAEQINTVFVDKNGNNVYLEGSANALFEKGKFVQTRGIFTDVTYKHKAQKALKKSEKRFREMAKLLPETVFETDVNLKLTFVNDSTFEHFGYSKEDIEKGINCIQLICPEDREKAITNLKERIKGKDIGLTEYIAIRKDGTTFPCLLKANPIYYEEKASGIRGFIIDITEQKKDEQALEKLNQTLLNLGPDYDENVNRLTRLAGELLGGSCALYNRLDEKREMLCALGQWKPPQDFEPEDKPQGHICFDVIKQNPGEVFLVKNLPETKYAETDPNVKKYDLKTYIGSVVKLKEKPIGSVCVVFQKDFEPNEEEKNFLKIVSLAISREELRKKSEEIITESQKKLSKIVSNASSALILSGEDGKIVEFNPSAEEIYNLNRDQALKKNHWEMISAIKIEKEPSLETIKKGNWFEGTLENHKIIQFKIIQIPTEEGKLFLQVANDITESKAAEMALKESEEKFRKLVDNMVDATLILDWKGQILFANRAAAELVELTEREAIGQNIKDFLHPSSLKTALRNLIKLKTRGVGEYDEYLIKTVTGKEKWVAGKGVKIKFKGKEVDLLNLRDITLQKQSEEAIEHQRNAAIALSSSHKVSEALNKLLEEVIGLKEIDCGGVYVTDEKGGLELITSKNISEKFKEQVSRIAPNSQQAKLALKGDSLFIPASEIKEPIKTHLKQEKILSFAMVPFKYNGKVVAVLNVGSRNSLEIPTVTKQILESIAAQMGEGLERINAERRLKESEEKFRNIVEKAQAGVILSNPQGNIIETNQAAEKIYGTKEEELKKMKVWDLFDFVTSKEFKKEKMKSLYLIASEVGKIRESRHRFYIKTPSGEERSLVSSLTTVKMKNGYGILQILDDITDIDQIRQALEKSEKRFHDVAMSSGDLIWEVDKNGRYTYTTGKVKEILGYEPKELLGKTPFDLMPEEEAARVIQEFDKAASAKKPIEDIENWNLRKDGTRVCLLTDGIPILDEQGNLVGYRGVDKDITSRKEAEERLKEAFKELKQLDSMKTDFMNIAAHELKTPLIPVIGYLDLILKTDLDEKQREQLTTVYRNAKRLNSLVSDILDISKLEGGAMKFQMQKTNPEKILENVVSDLSMKAQEKGVYLKYSPVSLKPICADEKRITQVLTNLVTNAIKFTDKGGITIKAEQTEEGINISVEDTGIGMKEDELEHIFTKFYQADSSLERQAEGTGLGLAISKGIIVSHGGEIHVESKLGEGSKFYFSLPFSPPENPGKHFTKILQEEKKEKF